MSDTRAGDVIPTVLDELFEIPREGSHVLYQQNTWTPLKSYKDE